MSPLVILVPLGALCVLTAFVAFTELRAGRHDAQVVELPRYVPLPPAQPPGQLHLWRPQPRARRPRWLHVVTVTGARSDRIHDLTIAATRAALVAGRDGAAWLVADDRTYAHVTTGPDGPQVTPTTGWPVLAARIITRHPQETTP